MGPMWKFLSKNWKALLLGALLPIAGIMLFSFVGTALAFAIVPPAIILTTIAPPIIVGLFTALAVATAIDLSIGAINLVMGTRPRYRQNFGDFDDNSYLYENDNPSHTGIGTYPRMTRSLNFNNNNNNDPNSRETPHAPRRMSSILSKRPFSKSDSDSDDNGNNRHNDNIPQRLYPTMSSVFSNHPPTHTQEDDFGNFDDNGYLYENDNPSHTRIGAYPNSRETPHAPRRMSSILLKRPFFKSDSDSDEDINILNRRSPQHK